VNTIQHYVIKFDRSMVSPNTPFFSTNITDCHDITEILLNAINKQTLTNNWTY